LAYQQHRHNDFCNKVIVMTVDQQFFDKLAGIYQDHIRSFPWYCYAAVVFQVHDKMELVGQTWRYVLEYTKDEEDQLRKARQMREALLKASVLVGFPKVSSWASCRSSWHKTLIHSRALML
jgi:hypothetical protein